MSVFHDRLGLLLDRAAAVFQQSPQVADHKEGIHEPAECAERRAEDE